MKVGAKIPVINLDSSTMPCKEVEEAVVLNTINLTHVSVLKQEPF